LEVKSAEAELMRARANLTNKKADYQREEAIFKEGAGSQRRLDQARFGFREAGAGVRVASSKLDLARRDLRKTTLYAPYDGSIGKRMIEPHMEVAAGQRLFEIDAEGDMEVEVNIPETVVNQITTGSETTVVLTVQPDQKIAGTVSYIGTMAETANAFPVKVALSDPPAGIQSGMTAEVTFPLKEQNGQPGYLLPPQAFLVGKEPGSAFVFVYDAGSSTVKKTPVRLSGAQDNRAIVTEGLDAGDRVVVAGLGFLSDGQKVRLMEQPASVKPESFELK
jgi:RND family efflux transporter MFP subunit